MSSHSIKLRDKTIFDGILVKTILKAFYISCFKLSGWKTINVAPQRAGITIAAPHTSNWDIFLALGAAVIFNAKIYFTIKESWCRIPVIGAVMLWLGAIPVNRTTQSGGQVKLIQQFVLRHKHSQVYFLFTPEGTRGHVEKWKTGFYHVAKTCDLPIYLAKVDYQAKVSGVFHSFQLTDNMAADIEAIQASYQNVCGKYPLRQFPAYQGVLPEISEHETLVLRALYSLKGMASQAEIAAKSHFGRLSQEMLDFMVEKGILIRECNWENGTEVRRYQLSVSGNGYLLHLTPTLAV